MLILIYITLSLLMVKVSPECPNGVDFQGVLNSFYLNSDNICLDPSGFVNAIASKYCCTFDSITCPTVKQMNRHFYRLYQTQHQLYYLCFYNTFAAISYACRCKESEKRRVCGISYQRRYFSPKITTYIVGGSDVKQCEFPWMVFIKSRNRICGASLIDSQHLITAAHCVENRLPDEIHVSMGTNDKEFIRRAFVSEVKIHPQYNETQYSLLNDIAILTLTQKIKFSACISPVCLPDIYFPLSSTNNCYASGWGKDAEAGKIHRLLQKVKIPIWNNTMCEKYAFGYSPGMLCGGYINGGKDSCGGDSGGPLVCPSNNRWVLTGIVSYGRGCARAYSPGVYTDVRYFLNWIEDNID